MSRMISRRRRPPDSNKMGVSATKNVERILRARKCQQYGPLPAPMAAFAFGNSKQCQPALPRRIIGQCQSCGDLQATRQDSRQWPFHWLRRQQIGVLVKLKPDRPVAQNIVAESYACTPDSSRRRRIDGRGTRVVNVASTGSNLAHCGKLRKSSSDVRHRSATNQIQFGCNASSCPTPSSGASVLADVVKGPGRGFSSSKDQDPISSITDHSTTPALTLSSVVAHSP